MKSLPSLIFTTFFLIIISCQQEAKNSVEGVWQLVSHKPLKSDGTIDSLTADEWKMMKMITKSHFSFVEQERIREKFTKSPTDEELCASIKDFFAGGGTYVLEGNTYTEYSKYFLNPTYVDLKISFEAKFINDDLWIQKGVLPTKELGLADEDYEYLRCGEG